jgi:Protein of unknown function (DUF533)
VDAVRVLGGLIASRANRAPGNGQVLGQILNGVANITAAANSGPAVQFPPTHHVPLEHLVRESVVRHHHAGGQVIGPVGPWIQAQPPARRVPTPRFDDQHQHPSSLACQQRAELLITAMVMAAQADGQLDADEQNRIIQQLQPLDPAEADFLRMQFGRRHDLERFVASVPNGLQYEVYSVSLLAMCLDTPAEAQYLRALAECMRMSPQDVNAIHQRVGAPLLY